MNTTVQRTDAIQIYVCEARINVSCAIPTTGDATASLLVSGILYSGRCERQGQSDRCGSQDVLHVQLSYSDTADVKPRQRGGNVYESGGSGEGRMMKERGQQRSQTDRPIRGRQLKIRF